MRLNLDLDRKTQYLVYILFNLALENIIRSETHETELNGNNNVYNTRVHSRHHNILVDSKNDVGSLDHRRQTN